MIQTAKKEAAIARTAVECAVLPLAATPPLAENSRLGFRLLNQTLHQGFMVSNSTTALGLRATLALDAIGKYKSARYYDPQIERFISEDPISFLGGVNFYVYVGNSPEERIDPLGLRDCKVVNGYWVCVASNASEVLDDLTSLLRGKPQQQACELPPKRIRCRDSQTCIGPFEPLQMSAPGSRVSCQLAHARCVVDSINANNNLGLPTPSAPPEGSDSVGQGANVYTTTGSFGPAPPTGFTPSPANTQPNNPGGSSNAGPAGAIAPPGVFIQDSYSKCMIGYGCAPRL